MNELYSGSVELFEGLWAGEHWGFEAMHRPVLWFKFARLDYKAKGVTRVLREDIDAKVDQFGLRLSSDLSVKEAFGALIEGAAATHDSGRVVILIDEYDKPIVDYVDDLEQAEANRDELRSFYGVLKDSDPYIELLFLTGVSAFAKVSLFSELNNVQNLTLAPSAYTIVGLTQTELEEGFGEALDATGDSREEVRTWYNGYAWGDHERVYNPWSILQLIKFGKLQNYWSESGTPVFLTKRLAQGGDFEIAPSTVSQVELLAFGLRQLNPRGVLFQGGYLTIKRETDRPNIIIVYYPNQEVKQTFLESLLKEYNFDTPSTPSARVDRLREAFEIHDLPTVVDIIDASLAAVTYQLYTQKSEAMIHAIIHTTFTVLGLYTCSEVSTSRGRADIVVEMRRVSEWVGA